MGKSGSNACLLSLLQSTTFTEWPSDECVTGPSYVFEVLVYNPALTALRQKQIAQASGGPAILRYALLRSIVSICFYMVQNVSNP